MLPIIPTAQPDNSGTSLSDRLTSPLFLMGIGMLTGGLQGRGMAGLATGAAAASQFQRSRAAQQAIALKQAEAQRLQSQQAAVSAALAGVPGGGATTAPQTAPGVSGAPNQPGMGVAPPSPAAAGTAAPAPSQGGVSTGSPQEVIKRRIDALMPLAMRGNKGAADAVKMLQAQHRMLQPQGSDIARIVEANHGPDWRTKSEGLAMFEQLMRAGAANVSLRNSPMFMRPQLVTDTDGSQRIVGVLPSGELIEREVRGATKAGETEKAAQAYIDTALPIVKDIEVVMGLSEDGPIQPFTAEAGEARTALYSAITALSSERGLGAISKDDKKILFGMLGDDPTTWRAQAQNLLTGGGWSEQQAAQLRTMHRILTRNIAFNRGRISGLSPSGRGAEAADLQRRVNALSDEEARARLRALRRKEND